MNALAGIDILLALISSLLVLLKKGLEIEGLGDFGLEIEGLGDFGLGSKVADPPLLLPVIFKVIFPNKFETDFLRDIFSSMFYFFKSHTINKNSRLRKSGLKSKNLIKTLLHKIFYDKLKRDVDSILFISENPK